MPLKTTNGDGGPRSRFNLPCGKTKLCYATGKINKNKKKSCASSFFIILNLCHSHNYKNYKKKLLSIENKSFKQKRKLKGKKKIEKVKNKKFFLYHNMAIQFERGF